MLATEFAEIRTTTDEAFLNKSGVGIALLQEPYTGTTEMVKGASGVRIFSPGQRLF